MDIQTIALIRGLLLPFRIYFQPSATFAQARQSHTPQHPNPPMLLVYAYSLIWIPISMLVCAALWGWPVSENIAPLIITGPALLVMLGGFMGIRLVYINQQWAGLAFDWTAAIAFGLFFALGLTFNEFVLDDIAEKHQMEIAEVVDSTTLDWPSQVILGLTLGATLEVGLATRVGLRKFVGYGLPICLGVMALMALISRPDLRLPNTLAFGLAGLLITHLAFQPIWLALHFLTLLLLRVNPAWDKWLWAISPAHWNEFSYIPLPGLDHFLHALVQQDLSAGMAALRQLKQHPFYGPLAERWLKDMYKSADV